MKGLIHRAIISALVTGLFIIAWFIFRLVRALKKRAESKSANPSKPSKQQPVAPTAEPHQGYEFREKDNPVVQAVINRQSNRLLLPPAGAVPINNSDPMTSKFVSNEANYRDGPANPQTVSNMGYLIAQQAGASHSDNRAQQRSVAAMAS